MCLPMPGRNFTSVILSFSLFLSHLSALSLLQSIHLCYNIRTYQSFLRRPSGTSQKAGIENYACRDGIQCKQHNCEFAHPSKSLKCKGQHQQVYLKPHSAVDESAKIHAISSKRSKCIDEQERCKK